MGAREWLRALWPSVTPPPAPAPAAAPATRTYAAADVSRLTSDWRTSIQSANGEIRGAHRRLKGAARSYERDTPYGARYPRLVTENVVGHHGIQLQMRLLTTRGTPSQYENDRIERAFKAWAHDPRAVSADGRLTFPEIQRLALHRRIVDGEHCVRFVRGADNAVGLSLQCVDADLLDETHGEHAPVRLANGHEIHMGVEIEPRYGRPVAYWLWTAHPSDTAPVRARVRVPAEDLLHLYRPLRPGQIRGVTAFAPVLFNAKMRAAFEEAAITAARVGASQMAAVTYDPEKAGGVPSVVAGQSNIPLEVEPARFLRLGPGEGLAKLDFDYPSETYGPFIKNIDRSSATGLNVAYTSLSGDLEAVNYSSIRAGLLGERDYYREEQQWLIAHLLRPVFREWCRMAALNGIIRATDIDALVAAADWKPRGWQWVDPQNDVEAAARAVQEGFATRSDICAERGTDFEDVLDRLKQEQALAAEYGVTLGAPSPAAPAADAEDDADDAASTPDPNRALRKVG